MTIQEAINKAMEGGYPKKRVADLLLHVQAQYFLAPPSGRHWYGHSGWRTILR